MLNQVALIGNLGKDPKIGETNGKSWAHLDVAVNDQWVDADGQRQERVTWVHVAAFGGLAKSLRKLAKGDQVAVCGRLQTNTFEADGGQRTTLEVVATSIDFLRVKARAKSGG